MAVERPRWTDERLDDLAGRMNRQYDELAAKIDRLQDSVDRLRGEFYDRRRWVLTMWLGFAALFVEIALLK
jgi:hypothetical protein